MQEHVDHLATAPHSFLPHGYCYLWNPPLLWTHLVSDLLIGVSYVAISFALAYLVHRARRDIPFSVVFIAFGLFIVTCGLTHFMEIWTLWNPAYWLAGGVKVVTASASVATAVAMPFTVPAALTTLRDAKLSREREVAAARAGALEEQNELLQEQAAELELQREEAETLAEELEATNEELRAAVVRAEAAQREAEQANRVKADFLATMSHELRTPLNAIGGYVELIEMGIHGDVSAAQLEALERVRVNQRHLLEMINDILSHARLDAGRMEFRIEPISALEVIASIEALLRPLLSAKGASYEVEPCTPEIRLAADAERVRQILLNLVGNAIKFSEGGGLITLSCGADDDMVAISVADRGRGIPEDKLDAIFDPFVQVGRALNRPEEGVGLGLAISRDLARGMGGELTVSSRLGEGSTFVLRLPRA